MWIDLEGIDGSGKTTLSLSLVRRLRALGCRVVHPRENGTFSSKVTARIRELTRDIESHRLAPETEFLLNAAREAQVLAEEIRPALARGDMVVTDRAVYSHVARASYVHRLPYRLADSVAEFVARGVWPDVIIYVDVDPDVARLRRRLRKIREKRLGVSGRKGLLGESSMQRLRDAFLLLAAIEPQRWNVLDNSWRTLSEAEEEAWAIVCPYIGLPPAARAPAPTAPTVVPGRNLSAWTENFFEFARFVADRDPSLAALYVAGMDDPRADRIRVAAAVREPAVAVWSASGLGSPGSWELRRRVRDDVPGLVARSLAGLDDPVAWSWRENLAEEVPMEVLHSLRGVVGTAAHEMRRKLWGGSPDEALRSLAGLNDPMSWGLRIRALRSGPSGPLIESLAGIDAPSAWQLRDAHRSEFPLSILRSVRGLGHEKACGIRREMSSEAPKISLETLKGMSGRCCEQLRFDLQERWPHEVAESLAGLATREAWRRRRALIDVAPCGVLSSLVGLEADDSTIPMIEEILGRSEGRPRLVRKAAIHHLTRAKAEVNSHGGSVCGANT